MKCSDLHSELVIGRLTLKTKKTARVQTKDGRPYTYPVWSCDCSCGNKNIQVSAGNLANGRTLSCKCLQKESPSKRFKTHGEHAWKDKGASPEYRTWCSIIKRCCNKNSPDYCRYGGRGIRICKKWRNSYEAFLTDMGRRPSKDYSIDRIDNNGHYCPTNCRWATRTEQCRNRRDNKKLTVNGVTKVLAEWSEISGTKSSTISIRLKRGATPEEAVYRRLRKNQFDND